MTETVRDLRLMPGEDPELLLMRAAKKLKIRPESIKSIRIIKRSLDARKKGDIHYVCSVMISTEGNAFPLPERFIPPEHINERGDGDARTLLNVSPVSRPVVVGFGPA